MKTIFNSKVFKGVSIAGKIVNGMAKNGVVFWQAEQFHSHTIRILNRANAIGAVPDTDLVKFDAYVRSMVDFWVNYCDVFYRFRGTGDVNFKRINLANPETVLADFFGGYTLDISGIKGNGVNAYVDTNFNPFLLVTGQKYQLNNASVGTILVEWETDLVNKNFALLELTNSNTSYLSLNVRQSYNRINSNAVISSPLLMTGLGMKIIGKNTLSEMIMINRDTNKILSQNSTTMPTNTKLLGHNLNSAYYNTMKLSSFFQGKSISFDLSQEIRTYENADMTNLGISPIA